MLRVSSVVAYCLISAVCWSSVFAQEASDTGQEPLQISAVQSADKPADKPAAETSKTTDANGQKATTRKRSARLPRFFGQLELSLEQREKVYSIQESFDQRIESLLQKLAQVKLDRDVELKSVLSDGQNRKLSSLAKPRGKSTKRVASASTK